MKARQLLLWLPVILVLTAAALLLRPVSVQGDAFKQTVWLWAWQSGQVRFVNSVTQTPVRIDFGLFNGFSGFNMHTDELTEQYYTHGSYAIDQRLFGEHSQRLHYCSMVGMSVQLGSRLFQVSDGCLEIRILWPPKFRQGERS